MSKPTQFDESIAEVLLARLRDGETLRRICFDESMPTTTTVWKWQNEKNGAPALWGNVYARARLVQADSFAHDILEIADNVDEISRLNAQKEVENLPINTSAARKQRAEFFAKRRSLEGARLAIDARKFLASKMNSRKWGDKVVFEIEQGEDDVFKLELKDIPVEQLERIQQIREELTQLRTEREVIEIPAVTE